MSKNLVPNSIPLSVELSRITGRCAALFLQQLHYWLGKAKHTIEGKPWIYNTYETWASQIGVGISTVKRVVAKLRDLEIIQTEKHRSKERDQTNWYTIDYDRLNALFAPIGSFSSVAPAQDEPVHQPTLARCSISTESTERENSKHAVALLEPEIEPSEPQPEDPDRAHSAQKTTPEIPRSIGEDDHSADASFLSLKEKVGEAIAPERMNSTIEVRIRSAGEKVVLQAIDRLAQARKGSKSVGNAAGWLMKAIEGISSGEWGGEAMQAEKSVDLPSFTQWFDLAKSVGVAIASMKGDAPGAIDVLVSDEHRRRDEQGELECPWIPYKVLIKRYSLEGLESLRA